MCGSTGGEGMDGGQLKGDKLSARQLSVAALVAGLSPAAALAGKGDWVWMLVWTAVGVGLRWITLRRVGAKALFRGGSGVVLSILYRGWAVVLAGRVLSRTATRLELTSGGSPRFWLLLLALIPLVWMCWGKAAPFFRTVEILWLAMAVTLALVLVFGLTRVEWRYVGEASEDWLSTAVITGEILAPSLFVLPYIYKVEEREDGRGLVWLAGLGVLGAALCFVTAGILGAAGGQTPLAFFVAAGTLGKTARCEGLLSVLWLLPDLTLAGLLCRVWGARRWPALAALLSAGLALSGLCDMIPGEIYAGGTILLLLFTLLLPGGKGKIVVRF